MTSPILSGRDDAERAARPAQELTRALYPALIEQDDGAELIDIQAWKDAGVPRSCAPHARSSTAC
jgi:hypothetical protein